MDESAQSAVDDCLLCQQLIENRERYIEYWRSKIQETEAEIAEIRRGDRHNDFHRRHHK